MLAVCTGPKGCRLIKLAFINLIYDYSLVKGCFLLQASKVSLHRAAVSGQHETVNETEYVDLSGDLFDQSDLLGPSFIRDVVSFFSVYVNLMLCPASRVRFTCGFFSFIVDNKIRRTV